MIRIVAVLIGVVALIGGVVEAQAQLPPGAVVCARSGYHVKYCPAGKTCCMAAGTCCDPGATCTKNGCVLPMSCSVCAANQKRDSDACMTSGNLMQQSECVNRVNAEFLRCETNCRP